jgi:protein MpaA
MTGDRSTLSIKYLFFFIACIAVIAVSGNNALCSIPEEYTKKNFCDAVNNKFLEFGWNKVMCNPDRWTTFNYSSRGNPLFYEEFGFHATNNTSPVNLLLCGVHGDEPSGIYICFQLVREILFDNPQELKDIRIVIAPIVNPDGFFANTRHNANGVDPNRNLPTKDWDQLAHNVWANYKKDPRKYPGAKSGSEPETKLQEYLINTYKPDKIITIHAPLGFLDFDGPGDQKYNNLIRIEKRAKYLGLNMEANSKNLLKLVDFRFFPGSIGNYAGNERKIPTYTIELPSSDPSMAQDYWSALRFALLKALNFEVYDRKEMNPFFRDEPISRQVAYTKPQSINAPANSTETIKAAPAMVGMNLTKSKHVLILPGVLVFFAAFQRIVVQRKRSIKKSIHVESQIMQPNVPARVKTVTVNEPPDNGKRLLYLSKKECEELINACEPHLKPIVIFALNTGMKKTEILNLKWEDVDIEDGVMMPDTTKNRKRMIPMNDILKKTVRNIPRRQDVPYVFYNTATGKPYRNISKSFAKALKEANIENYQFRDLRHTFASHLILEGVDIKKVMAFLGHKTLKTASKYSHLTKPHTV